MNWQAKYDGLTDLDMLSIKAHPNYCEAGPGFGNVCDYSGTGTKIFDSLKRKITQIIFEYRIKNKTRL